MTPDQIKNIKYGRSLLTGTISPQDIERRQQWIEQNLADVLDLALKQHEEAEELNQRLIERREAYEEHIAKHKQEERNKAFALIFADVAKDVHTTAVAKGWWDERFACEEQPETGEFSKASNNSSLIALMHSELSEALEALRHGNPPDDKIPEFSGVEAELADVVIRIMDAAAARNWRVGQAIEAKIEMNKGRSFKHGGKAF